MPVQFILGIDGGGSNTRACIADQHGNILGSGYAGSSNYQAIGFDAATQALLSAIKQAREAAGLTSDTHLAAACFGLAGVGRPLDRVRFEAWSEHSQIARRTTFVTDAELVMMAGTPSGWGIILIAGTGSICLGRTVDGRNERVGGWGYMLGDEGSGYDLAIRSLRLACQTADGRAEAHAILQLVLNYWQLETPQQLIPFVYAAERNRAEIASISAPVLALAKQGDPHALQLRDQLIDDLAVQLRTMQQKLGIDQPPIALTGGILGNDKTLCNAIVERSGIDSPHVHYVQEPVQGAILLARKLL
jgi:N-acetylglucosamine kinase-like BadF-type ATPase